MDNTGDKTGPINPGDKTDETKPEFNGKGEPGSTITITDNGEVIGTAVVDENGNWTFTPEEELGEGNHSIVITETDEAGNSSEPSESIDFVVDTTPPSKPDLGSVTDNAGGITGPIKPGGATDDTTPTFTGEGEPGNTITIKDGDKVIGTVIVDENGAWSYTPETELGEGSHNIIVTETDEAGNTSEPSDGFEFIVDTTAPNSANLSISGVMDNYGEITGNITNGGATDDSRPVISGTGTAGDTIILYVNDGTGNHEIGRGTVGSDGKWSIQPETPLLPGSNQFTAVEMDPAGNKTDPSNQYTVTLDVSRPSEPVIVNVLDNVGDVVGPLQKGDVTDDNKPTITGTAEAGYTIRIYDGATLLGTATADSKGVWTFTPDTALADGKHNITATATSPVGQTSDKTGIFNFEVDSKAPESVQNLTVKDNVGDYQGPLKDGDTTDDNTLTFSGKAEAGSTVTIYADGKVLGTAKVDGEGKWTFTPDSALADGVYNFTTTVTDKAGNINPDGPGLTLTVDTSTHPVSIVALIDDVGTVTGNISANGATDDTKPEITGQGKPGATIKVYDGSTLLGETTVKANGSWSFTPSTDLKEGAHSITVTMTDKAGNLTGPTAAFDFTIDTTAPNMPTIDSAFDDVGSKQGSLASGSMTDDSTPTLKGTAEKGSLVTIYDGSKVLGSVTANSITGEWGFTPSTPISEGGHKFHVTATDAAGNVSQPSADFLLTTDYTGPNSNSLSITGVDDRVGAYTGNVKAGETTDDTRPTISGTGTAGDTIIVYVKDGSGEREIGRATVDGNGKWSLQPASPLAKGANEFTAVEMDPVGNTTDPSAPYAIVIDNSRPLPPVIEMVEDNVGTITGALQKGEVTDDNKPTISGTAVANGIVTIYNNNTVIGSAQVDSKGNWTFTPNTALADGKYNITVTATSPVGQVSEPTGNWNFEIDTAAPSAAENLLISDNVGSKQGALKDGDVTDDATPTFSGKAEAGSTVSIYSDGNLLGTAKVAADGSWSFTPSSSLPDGDYKFTTTVTDKAGNTGAATPVVNIKVDTSGQEVSLDKVVDNVGEITGNISPNGVTDDTRPEIVGTGKPGSIIKVYDGATLLGSTTVNADKSWSFTPPSDLGQGKHSITVTATDLSGNTTEPSSAFEFTIDTVTPTQPTIESAKDDVGTVQGNLNNGGATDDPTPTLTGKAEKGSTVKVYDGDTLLGSVVADDTTGQWTFTPTSPLVEGEHKFHVTSTDKAGNTSLSSADFVLNMDFTGPDPDALKITGVDDQVGAVTGNVKDGSFTDDSRPTINGTGTAGNTIYVYVSHESGANVLLGTTTVQSNGTWSLRPVNTLAEGSNKFTAKERDPVGNEVGPSNSYTVTLDGTPAVVPTLEKVIDDVGIVTGELKSGDVTDDTKPTFVGSASADCVIRVYDGSTLLGSTTADSSGKWSFESPTALKDGTHNITFTATSPIGQVSDPSDVFVLEVDTKVPSPVESLIITDNAGAYQGELKHGDTTDDATPTFSGKAEAGSTVTIYNNGVAIGSTTVSAGGTWSFTPNTDLPDGNYKFTTTVTDKAGNVGDPSSVVNIIIDTSTLSVAIEKLIDDVGAVTGNIQANGITDDLRPEIVGTSSKPGSIITVYIDGVNQGTTTVKADGSWSFTPTTDLGQGTHTVTVTAKDLSGNVTPMSPEFSFTIDNVAPSAPTIDKALDNAGDITGDLKTGDYTDDNTPTLSGTAEKGSIVTIYDENDKVLGSVLVNEQGKWSYELPSQADGRHDYYVIASDIAGNKSNPTSDFTLNIDTQGPAGENLKLLNVLDNVGNITGNLVSGSGTDDSRPEFKGTANEVGNTVIIYATDGSGITREVGRTTVDVNREWSHELANALADGNYKFTVVEMDAAGNKTVPTPEFGLLIDTTIPTATATISNMTDDVGPITGNLPSGSYTDDSIPRLNGFITGTLGANDKVVIYEKGTNGVLTALGEATMLDNTRWQFDIPPGSLVGGNTHNYVAAVTNKVGTISTPSADFAMTSIVEINSDTTLDTTPIISGRIPYTLELGSHMTVTVNGKTYSSLTGAVVVDTVNLTWYVQIPDSDALTANRTYDVDVRIVSSLGGTTDKTANELTIAPTPEVIIDAGGTDGNNKATTFGMNNKGGWQIFSNQVVLDSNATSNSTIGQFNKTILTPNTGGAGYGNDNMNMVQNATFVDFNRDGHMDILGVDSRYSNGQQMFINNGDGTYTAKQMDGLANTYSWYGGVAAIDLKGDGYVDFLVGDQTPDDANAVAGTNSQIVMNEGGVFAKDTWYTNSTANGGKNTNNSTFGKSLSGIDLNNDGAVDIVFHGEAGSSKVGSADGSNTVNSTNSYRLVVATNSGDGKVNTTQIIEGLFFNYWSDPSVANAASMTWADYNGDGYMDLFQGSNAGGYNVADARNSRIYFNDGAGKLNMVDPNNDGIGSAVGSGYYQFNDNMLGGASVAVDWNGDGKMDVIEAPMIGYNNLNDVNIGGSINLYTNTTSGSSVNFSTTYLQTKSGSTEFGLDSANRLNFKGSISAAGVVTNNPVTGMLSVDLDYDGAKDLLVFTSKGQTTYVKNNTVIADGTSLHLRIVDEQGVTIFYGNTVQLIDSTGKVVATQVINLQSGNQVNDSTSVVDFYGLNPNETYSVVLLRNVNGASQDVGSVSQVGTNTIENVNLGWGNIKAGAANEALILTAESGSNSANTIGSGVVGTGYNDTFIATQGTKVYEGGGGTTEMSSYQTWTETGGMDIVDFKLAGNTNLTINMMNKGSQYTGWNTITMKNIEGIAGGAGNDTFTDDKGDNVFEGRAGNDTFNLVNGGRDTLLYKPQSGSTGDNRGGNGSDVVNGFALGAREATPNADRIDVSEMLTGYTFGGGAKWINGVATMEVGETIANYLKVEVSGSDTLIYIDRDGNGSAYGFELLLTLKGVQTDLVTLLANHQLEVDNGSTVKMSATTSEFQAITQMFTAGNDIMFGTEQEDILLGGLGNDTFIGISKDDQVKGGDGNDTIKVISTDFSSISGDAGIDTLVLDTKGDLFDLSALKDKLNSIEIFDMGNGHNTMNVSLEDVLRLGSEELAINSGNKAIVVNGEAGSILQLEGADGQWTMSQSNYQYQGNTYNVWTMGTSGVEVLVENTVNPVIL
ncbi:Ig-like domain-containing protein [Limnobaculum eriocheiris]|uniref:Ig-like domain-containing protein n=1 Tax=Limnobaculum eriocheiris TaxID=2897391 RepID=UPI003B84765A